MLSALFAFLGGSAFRMIWGELASWLNRREDHEHEIDRLRLQADLDDKRHARDLERIRLQHELGVTEIQVAGDVAANKMELEAFTEAIRNASRPSGVPWVDAWNASIRPQYAEVALALWLLKLIAQGFVMDEFDIGLMAVIAGFFFADRSLSKRAK